MLFSAFKNSYAQTEVKNKIGSDWNNKAGKNGIHQPLYALLHWREIEKSKTYAGSLIARGAITFQYSPEEALIWYNAALPFSLLSHSKITEVYDGIAATYAEMGKYEMGLSYFQKALNYLPDNDSEKTKARIYSNIGALFVSVGNFDKATTYYDKALEIYSREKDDKWLAIMLFNKGVVLGLKGNYEQEADAYKNAYNIVNALVEQHNTDKAILNLKCVLLNNMANYYIKKSDAKKNDADSAIYLLKKSILDIAQLTQVHQSGLLISYGIALAIKKDYKNAEACMELGLNKAIQCGHKEIAIHGYESLSDLYEHQGNYKKALESEHRYIALKDSLFEESKKNINYTNDLEGKYAIAKKDKEIAQKQLQLNIQVSRLYRKNFWTIFMGVCLLSVIVILLIFRRNYLQRQNLFKEQLANTEKSRKIMQIEATMKGEETERTRIAKELHDGVVSEVLAMKLNLSTIKHEHTVLQSSQNFQNILMQAEEIAQKLRQTAHNLMPVDTDRKSLQDSISSFLKRISNQNIHFRFQCYGEIPVLAEEVKKIILLMILELIQNIIKHSRATEALIQLDCFEDILGITVEDNGVGLDSKITYGDGMGLANLKENANLLQATLDVKSSEYKGSTFYIEVPLENNKYTHENS